jgi:error-prone DNA polymerase
MRLGFREIKGFPKASAAKIVAARDAPFTSVEECARRTGLAVADLRRLAEADGFRSIGLDRREACAAVLYGGGALA